MGRRSIYYYRVAVLAQNLSPLTYQSPHPIENGTIVSCRLQRRSVRGVVIEAVSKPDFKCLEIDEVETVRFDPAYLLILNFISQYYSCEIGEAAGLFHPVMPREESDFSSQTEIELSQSQKEALAFAKSHPVSLLFGDTGSGKSEIYMKWFEEVLNSGKRAIFLLPEISLTPQMSKRLTSHFGESVAVWHSKITPKKKREILAGIADGTIRILAGARSALFVTMPKLGLIVVDEEHDDSYKSAQRPRYHARDLAIYMGKALGAQVLLGSATPSVTSYHKYPHFRLKGTYHESQKKFLFESGEGLSETILAQIDASLQSKRQVIVFLPTRANFKYLHCRDCGAFVECPYCSVGMSLHLDRHALMCHYCHYVEPIPQICPKCSASAMRTQRIGTAQVLKELQDYFPEASIEKFDRDEIKSQRQLNARIKAFNDHQIDILVGTQMLSKGHNYLNVDLAVVLGIDTLLSQPDFRARERAVSLLLQIAGRSGRSGEGRVVIQSKNRDFFAPYLEDYERFIREDLQMRRDLYPPFTYLMRILISHKDQLKAKDMLLEVGNCCEAYEDVEVIGAGEAPIARIAGKFRFAVLLRSHKRKPLLEAARRCRCQVCEIDIDPISFS